MLAMIPVAIVTWLLFFCIQFPLILLGWITIPTAAAFKAYEVRKSQYFNKDVLAWKWKWMWVWGNEEDGIGAGKQYKDMGSEFKQIVYWSANRNPVNNLRFTPILSFKLDPKKVRYVGSETDIKQYDTKKPQWFFAWHGLYSGFFWQFNMNGKLRRFWIGWKIYPTDVNGVTSYRKDGVGFAAQFKVVR